MSPITIDNRKSPFKFLDAYDKGDRAIFFGREEEIEELYAMVHQSNLTLVYGQSGTGKTSLIQCGLANRFDTADWFNLYVRRNDDINASLEQVLDRKLPQKRTQASTLAERLRKRRQSNGSASERAESIVINPLVQKIRTIYSYYMKPIYLIFDQFEELFILGTEEEQQAFYQSIAEILETEGYCRAIFILREEAIAYLHDFEKVLPHLFDKRLRVEAMSRAKTQEVIRLSAEKFDITLADEQIPDIIIDVISAGQGRVELTYLQVFLDHLFQLASEGNVEKVVFDQSLIQELGGIEDVLANFLDKQSREIQLRLNQNFPKTPLDAVRTVLSAFVTLEGTKRPMSKEEVKVPDLSHEALAFCLDEFEAARLLRFEEGQYELVHDTIAFRVAQQRSEEEVAILQVTRLVKDRFSIYTTTNTLLNRNEITLVKSHQSRLDSENRFSKEEQAYIQKSVRENRKKRIRRLVLVAASFLILASFSGFSMVQWQNARKQKEVAEEQKVVAEEALKKFQAAQLAENDAKYREHLERGKGLMASSNYYAALKEFDTAVEYNHEGAEAITMRDSALSKSNISESFNELIAQGDALFNRGSVSYVDARVKYSQAVNLNYNNSLAESKLNTVIGRLENVYNDFLRKGDTYFRAEGYKYALIEYREALRIKPDNSALEEKIAECKKHL